MTDAHHWGVEAQHWAILMPDAHHWAIYIDACTSIKPYWCMLYLHPQWCLMHSIELYIWCLMHSIEPYWCLMHSTEPYWSLMHINSTLLSHIDTGCKSLRQLKLLLMHDAQHWSISMHDAQPYWYLMHSIGPHIDAWGMDAQQLATLMTYWAMQHWPILSHIEPFSHGIELFWCSIALSWAVYFWTGSAY